MGTHALWATRDKDDWIQDVPNMEVGGSVTAPIPSPTAFGARVVSAANAKGHTGILRAAAPRA
ncbi:hypothetical protein [Streptomyces sp. KL116D]|uniref:hypothetical protein n=1 Tax=Streptomyces sp. KL116D TaxID=3045152 RepID=UPI003558C7E2